MVRLPSEYEKRMRELLGEEEFGAYLASFDRPVWQGFRVNTAKLGTEEFLARRGLSADPVAWCGSGFYASGDTKDWSKHPDYYAGLYYLQEPSAMAPAAILPVEPGDRVLDLCAAPGGKSTQLAARLSGRGVLVSNDISASRAKALLKNLELFGCPNMAVLSEAPYRLAERFAGYFDKVLVDAPCSGEGMFHKEPAIMKNWEQYGSEYYAKLQREILPAAVAMLRPGGMLLYSTCTFAPLEDEQTVEWLLDEYPELSLVPFEKAEGIDDGHPEWSLSGREELRLCARFWPHRLRGQGHFVALLRKSEEGEAAAGDAVFENFAAGKAAPSPEFTAWAAENLATAGAADAADHPAASGPADFYFPGNNFDPARLRTFGDNLFYTALPAEALAGLRVLRNGIFLGELSHGRFEPTEAFAMTLRKGAARRELDLAPDDGRVLRYLKGETLTDAPADGWYLVLCGGFPLGWAKASGGIYKNKYLKAWKM